MEIGTIITAAYTTHLVLKKFCYATNVSYMLKTLYTITPYKTSIGGKNASIR